MKFKDFQVPVLFSSTFKALNLAHKNSSTFKDFQGCVGTLDISIIYSQLFQTVTAQTCTCNMADNSSSYVLN